MKRVSILSLILIFAFCGLVGAAGTNWNGYPIVKVLSGGKELKTSVPAISVKGQTFVSIPILKQLGLTVTGDAKNVKIELPKPKEPEKSISYEDMAEISKNVGIVHAVFPDGTGKQGSGVILPNNVFVTACHVACGASSLRIELNGNTYSTYGKGLFENSDTDLYGVTINAPSTIRVNAETQPEGTIVYAIGYPGGKYKVTKGYVYGTIDLAGRVISNTAPIDGGSSGGALINADGELIGLTLSSSLLTDKNLARSMYTVNEELARK